MALFGCFLGFLLIFFNLFGSSGSSGVFGGLFVFFGFSVDWFLWPWL